MPIVQPDPYPISQLLQQVGQRWSSIGLVKSIRGLVSLEVSLEAMGGLVKNHDLYLSDTTKQAATALLIRLLEIDEDALADQYIRHAVEIVGQMAREVARFTTRRDESVTQAYKCIAKVATYLEVDTAELSGEATDQDEARGRSDAIFVERALRQADWESRRADYFRALSVFAFLLLAAASVFTFFMAEMDGSASQFTLNGIAHALAFLPFLLLIGYLARESSQHRHVSRELNFKTIQLSSALAFAEGISTSRRGDFLHDLGKRMFAAPFNQPGKDTQAGLPAAEIEGYLDRIAEILRAARTGL